MAQTANLNLTKPALSDSFKLDDWNGNMQKIDDWAGTVNTALATITALEQRIQTLEQQNGGGGND